MTLRELLTPAAYNAGKAEKLRRQATVATKPIWTPFPGPQTLAVSSEADELFYGGQAGGGKTDLLLGAAATAHTQSIIFRRIFPSLRGIIERSREIFNREGAEHGKDSYNESLHIWRLVSGRVIEFGSMQYEKDKENYRGRPHDLYGFDEVTEFTESQFRFVNVWNRSTVPGQRCRVIATGNPPTSARGEWVIRYWAPWLDPKHPNPAAPGELRWFARLDDADVEVDGPEPFDHNGEIMFPRSRTFIPAKLSDNPVLEEAGYRSVLQGLPEPLRSQLLYGDFGIGMEDNPYQVIPTAWVQAAMDRWRETPQPESDQTAVGLDTAYGGRDKTVIALRYGGWLAPLLKYPGKDTPDGRSSAMLVIKVLKGNPIINVDPIGYGSAATEHLQDYGQVQVRGVNFGAGTTATDKTRRLKFANVRAETYWHMRELLDPETGQDICLPDDRELLSDLTSAQWELRTGKIYIAPKEEIKETLGRSPDCGDAAVLAFYGSDPLPPGTSAKANPAAPSRFVRQPPDGGRWGRVANRRRR